MARASSSGAATDVGRVRAHNEDTFLVRPELGLFLVADGMGGHQAGDVASAMVRLSVADFFEVSVNAPWDSSFDDPVDDEGLSTSARRLRAAIRKANHDVHLAAEHHPSHMSMGSTVVACYLPEGEDVVHIAHVGDSRVYRIRGAEVELLTHDHSLVNEARALDPEMTEAELARLPTNIITRALGLEPSVDVDVRTTAVAEGDTYLLCSDGLSGLVTDAEILEAVRLVDDAREVCELLVDMANEAGGMDNITAVTFKIGASNHARNTARTEKAV